MLFLALVYFCGHANLSDRWILITFSEEAGIGLNNYRLHFGGDTDHCQDPSLFFFCLLDKE